MEIIYVDNHLLVVNKQGGIPTQESPGCSDNATDWAKGWIKRKYDKPGKVFLEPIHRLDKPVSGLVLFARTSKALSRLQEMMRERKIGKWYYALVQHAPSEGQGVLEHYLVHDEHRARVVPATHPEGKKALLSYRILQEASLFFLLEVELHTGRYHQIRAQLAQIRSPIVGDQKYGSSTKWFKDSIALHHGKLALVHPVTKEELTLTSPFPSSFLSISAWSNLHMAEDRAIDKSRMKKILLKADI